MCRNDVQFSIYIILLYLYTLKDTREVEVEVMENDCLIDSSCKYK